MALYMYQPNVLPAQIVINNEDILGDLDLEKFSLKTVCTTVKNNYLYIDTSNQYMSENSNFKPNSQGRYEVNNNTKYYMRKYDYEYSPNGNIQKTIVSYSEINKSKIEELSKEKPFVDLWINENICETIIMDYREQK